MKFNLDGEKFLLFSISNSSPGRVFTLLFCTTLKPLIKSAELPIKYAKRNFKITGKRFSFSPFESLGRCCRCLMLSVYVLFKTRKCTYLVFEPYLFTSSLESRGLENIARLICSFRLAFVCILMGYKKRLLKRIVP